MSDSSTHYRWIIVVVFAAAVGFAAALWYYRDPTIPEANLAMAERLRAIDAARTAPSPFEAEGLVRLYSEMDPPVDKRSWIRWRFQLAQALLAAGDSERANQNFAEGLNALAAQPALLSNETRQEAMALQAVSQLRAAEQQNCLNQHQAESCILPLEGGGLHQFNAAALMAMRSYQSLLQERPDDLVSKWLLNITAMAAGQHPQGVPIAWRIEPERFVSPGQSAAFIDVAPQRGIRLKGAAGGVILEDFDRDGDLDLLVSSWGPRDPLHYFVNNGRGEFSDQTRRAFLDGLTGGLNLVQADVDNDGLSDVLVMRGAWWGEVGAYPPSLLRNLGDGRFEDITEQAGLDHAFPSQAASFGDFDNDGWLDLFVGNEGTMAGDRKSRLYRNLGRGRFQSLGAAYGLLADGFVKSAHWLDYDDDGWLDLFVATLDGPNQLWQSRSIAGQRAFVEVAGDLGLTQPIGAFSSCVFDADDDGRLDLLVFSYPRDIVNARGEDYVADYLGLPPRGEPGRFFRNIGQGKFEDGSPQSGLAQAFLTMGLNTGDLNHDGLLDLYLGTGAPDFRSLVPNRLLLNRGSARFEDASSQSRTAHLQKGHGIAIGDMDRDGDDDIYAVLGGAYSGDVYQDALFEQPGQQARFVGLRLEGKYSNRSGLHARVRLTLRRGAQRVFRYRQLDSGCSFGGNPLALQIALQPEEQLDEVAVRWLGDQDWEEFSDVLIGQRWLLREGTRKAIADE